MAQETPHQPPQPSLVTCHERARNTADELNEAMRLYSELKALNEKPDEAAKYVEVLVKDVRVPVSLSPELVAKAVEDAANNTVDVMLAAWQELHEVSGQAIAIIEAAVNSHQQAG